MCVISAQTRAMCRRSAFSGKVDRILITDPEGRTYRDLNRALAMDF
jgi:hypothetical protein